MFLSTDTTRNEQQTFRTVASVSNLDLESTSGLIDSTRFQFIIKSPSAVTAQQLSSP